MTSELWQEKQAIKYHAVSDFAITLYKFGILKRKQVLEIKVHYYNNLNPF